MKSPSRKPSEIRSVPISQMRIPHQQGVQRKFRQAHADKIAAELDLNKLGFPIVNERGSGAAAIYWVIDGQHRIAALKIWDPKIESTSLDCEVYKDLTDSEMADFFLGRNNSKPVPVLDKFFVACTAGYARETLIRKTVEANGQKITRDRNDGISAVSALGKVFDQNGEQVLGQVIRTINVGFGGDPTAFDGTLMQGIGLIYNRFNGRTNEKNLGLRLNNVKQGAREVLRKAEALRERTGNQKTQCVAAVIVDIYNKAEGPHSKQRLSPWWKEAD